MSLVPLWMHPLDPALYTLRAQVLQLYADPRLTHGRGRGTRAPWLYRTVPSGPVWSRPYRTGAREAPGRSLALPMRRVRLAVVSWLPLEVSFVRCRTADA